MPNLLFPFNWIHWCRFESGVWGHLGKSIKRLDCFEVCW